MQHRYSLIRFFTLAALLLPGTVHLSGADKGIGVTLLNYTLQHTPNNDVNPGYTLSITARVKNFDTASFSGLLDFGLRNSIQSLSNTGIFSKPRYSGQLVQLGGGEEVPAIFSVTIDPFYFIAPGPDVVVVWPISPVNIEDSILIHINILDTSASGIEENLAGDFRYNAMKDRIQLFNAGGEQLIFKQVRIFDLFGRLLANNESRITSEVPLPDLPRGIYVCEMLTTDNQVKTIKFVR